jgi:hypothetical protein
MRGKGIAPEEHEVYERNMRGEASITNTGQPKIFDRDGTLVWHS